MKRLGIIGAILVLLLAVTAAPAYAAKPVEKWVEHDVVRQEMGETIFIGVQHGSATILDISEPNGEVIIRVANLSMLQSLRLFEWDPIAQKKGELLATVEIHIKLSGEVTEDFFDGEGPLNLEEIVNGHLVVQWHIKDFTGELLEEEYLHGLWHYWFEDGEVLREQGWGEFPF